MVAQLLIPQKYRFDQLAQLTPAWQYRSFLLVIHLAIHETPQKRFLFVEEAAGGLHGNNRVGGNSIAETIVFGRQAGQQVTVYARGLK